MCLACLWFTLSVNMVVSKWLRFLIVWLIMLYFCVAISYFIFIDIYAYFCLSVVYTIQILLFSACCNLHPYRLYLIELLGFWVELFFSSSQLCLVYMLSWHSVTLYVTNLSLIHVYFHLLCSALVVKSSVCLQMAPSPTKKKTLAKKIDKSLKMDHNLFRSVQHFERYKDSFLKGTIIQKGL